MLQAGQDGGDEGLQNLLFPDAAQEAQRHTPDVLIGMLQVVAQVLADEDLQGRSNEPSVRRAVHTSLHEAWRGM